MMRLRQIRYYVRLYVRKIVRTYAKLCYYLNDKINTYIFLIRRIFFFKLPESPIYIESFFIYLNLLALINFHNLGNVNYVRATQVYFRYISSTSVGVKHLSKDELFAAFLSVCYDCYQIYWPSPIQFITNVLKLFTSFFNVYSTFLNSYIYLYLVKRNLRPNFFISIFNSLFISKNRFYAKRVDLIGFKLNLKLWLNLSTIYSGLKTLMLPVVVTLVLGFVLVDYYNINFTRQLAIWFVVGIIFFWLVSGFNFFLKRYRFGKFTSAIQRFWKRTNSYFWIVEGFLFSLFFYYYLNSSQEVLYFFDEANLSQSFVTNLTSFYFSATLLLFLIFYLIFVLLNLPNFTFKQNLTHLTVITIFFIYGFLLETYQFYYIISGFFELNWEFNDSLKIWVLDSVSPWVRVKNQYLTLALIAKYWHFLFIFISWLFMLFKFYETRSITYTLLGVNIQNYMLLFILNLLLNVNWLKWIFRRYFDESYFWFFSDFNHWSTTVFLEECNVFFSVILSA